MSRPHPDLYQGPADLQSAALDAELRVQVEEQTVDGGS